MTVRTVEEGDADLEVSIRATEQGYSGIVRRSDRTARELTASRCDELASALGLVASLSLVPRAQTDLAPAAPASVTAPVAAVSGWEPVTAPPPAWHPVPGPVTPAKDAPATPRQRSSSMAIGAAALIEPNAIAPGITPGIGLALESQSSREKGLSPTLGLGGWYAARQFEDEIGGARVRWFGARLDGCGLMGNGPVRLGPCLTLGAGVLRATGQLANPSDSTNGWFDVALSARLLLTFTEGIALDLRAGGAVPLVTYSYDVRNPDHSLYTTPGLAGRMSLGMSWKIP